MARQFRVIPAASAKLDPNADVADVVFVGSNAAVAVAVGDAPTKAEHDALVTAYNELAKEFNALVAGLVAAGVVKTS